MSDEIFVSLSSVFSYLQSTVDSRCIVEGEELLNAKHVILIGTTGETDNYVDVLALCLQTSSMKSSPHEIRGKLLIANRKITISKFECSCKAGLSGTCKHIAAVLLKCTRASISAFEKLSSTDLKCYWSNKKKVVQAEYEAKPILETDCFESKVLKKPKLTLEQEQECFDVLTSICPESSLACHLKGRSGITHSTEAIQEISISLERILACASNSKFLTSININPDSYQLKPCCESILKNVIHVKDCEKALTCLQKSDIWYQERMFRITGSRCYSLYTYSKEDWETKTNSFFWQKKVTTKYTEHGIKYEKDALEQYRQSTGYDVAEMGLVICQQYPWLAYSPDGVVMTDGFPRKLVEIKCPYDGIDNDAINFIHTCSYLEVSVEQGITLKKKHPYFGQVQLGMAILNLSMCDLILYSAKSKTFLNISVPFDEDFTRNMITNVTDKYFKFMIHYICRKRGTEST